MSEYDVMSPKTKVALGCLALAFLLLLCSLVLSVKSVGATSVAVSERFGKVQGVRKPGVHFELFSNYTTYDTKIQKYESKQGAATNDLQDIDVSVTVVYRIDAEKALEIYKNIGDEKMIEEKALKPLVAQNLKVVSTQYSGEEFAQKRAEVTTKIQESLGKQLSEKYNIEVVEVSLTNFEFTNKDFNAAIDRKQIAEQDALKAKYELDKTRIEAEQQKVQKESLSPAILQRMWIEKWDGHLPTYMGNGSELMTIPTK